MNINFFQIKFHVWTLWVKSFLSFMLLHTEFVAQHFPANQFEYTFSNFSQLSTLYRLVNRVILSILYQYGNNIISFESGWYLVCIIYCEFSSERDAISIRNYWLTNKWKWVFDHTKCWVWKFLRIVFGPQMQKLVSNFDFY